jgi:dsDNA-specific endonuclease/ATPase MutS2
MGPAYRATLRMLEWGRLCSHVAQFASTHVGKARCLELEVGLMAEDTSRLVNETK